MINKEDMFPLSYEELDSQEQKYGDNLEKVKVLREKTNALRDMYLNMKKISYEPKESKAPFYLTLELDKSLLSKSIKEMTEDEIKALVEAATEQLEQKDLAESWRETIDKILTMHDTDDLISTFMFLNKNRDLFLSLDEVEVESGVLLNAITKLVDGEIETIRGLKNE